MFGISFFLFLKLETNHQIVQILLSGFINIVAMKLKLHSAFDRGALDIQAIDLNLAAVDHIIMFARGEILAI